MKLTDIAQVNWEMPISEKFELSKKYATPSGYVSSQTKAQLVQIGKVTSMRSGVPDENDMDFFEL